MSTFALAGILAAEDPNQTHHPIFPETPEMLWGTLSFLVVAFLLWKFAWPQIKQMMAARTARIQAQLDEAATAKTEADEAAVAVREAKGDIASERQRTPGRGGRPGRPPAGRRSHPTGAGGGRPDRQGRR